jgi:hypothetical protein
MTKAPPTTKERTRLYTQLQRLVDKLHGKDEEGERYARVQVQDRRDGRWPYVRPIPRIPWEDPTAEQFEAALDAAASNVHCVAEDMEHVRRDIQAYLQRDTQGRVIRAIARKVLGETCAVGEAYSRYDNAQPFCQWKTLQKLDEGSTSKAYRYDYFNLWPFGATAFEDWLKQGKKTLLKENKNVVGWYVRVDGAVGVTLSALAEIPEEERPKHIAARRARREFLETHAAEVTASAAKIEAELRAKGKK